jgi:hypothetical protein
MLLFLFYFLSLPFILRSFPLVFLSCCIHFLSCFIQFSSLHFILLSYCMHVLSCSFHVPFMFYSVPFMLYLFPFMFHPFRIHFLSFSFAMYQTYRSSKGDMLKPVKWVSAQTLAFSSCFVLVLLSIRRPVQVAIFRVHEHVQVYGIQHKLIIIFMLVVFWAVMHW